VDSRADRMDIWLQNVESMCAMSAVLGTCSCCCFHILEVVADAKQNFASSNASLLTPLPVAPGPQTRRPSRDNSNRSIRPSHKAVAANQIFQVKEDTKADESFVSTATSVDNDLHCAVPADTHPAILPGGASRPNYPFESPRPIRRATVLGHSPEQLRGLDIEVDMTPSKRKEKSKSANDLKRLIRPISKVQLELDKCEDDHDIHVLSFKLISLCSCGKVKFLCGS
jgi:serine/threonine-protein kinase GIN4